MNYVIGVRFEKEGFYKFVALIYDYGKFKYGLVENLSACSHFKTYQEAVKHISGVIDTYGIVPEILSR